MSDSIQKEKGQVEEQLFAVGYYDINEQSYMKLEDSVAVSRFADDIIADQQRVIDRMKEFIDEAAVCPDVLNMFHNFKKCDFCITKRKLLGENNG